MYLHERDRVPKLYHPNYTPTSRQNETSWVYEEFFFSIIEHSLLIALVVLEKKTMKNGTEQEMHVIRFCSENAFRSRHLEWK